jgi:hypothetical protein
MEEWKTGRMERRNGKRRGKWKAGMTERGKRQRIGGWNKENWNGNGWIKGGKTFIAQSLEMCYICSGSGTCSQSFVSSE